MIPEDARDSQGHFAHTELVGELGKERAEEVKRTGLLWDGIISSADRQTENARDSVCRVRKQG